MAPIQSKVKQYLEGELDLEMISEKSYQTLGVHPFRWQLEAAAAILSGRDVVLDVGTGSGKTLCFSLPLLLNEKDISITVSPLTALMIDQTENAKISSIPICKETLAKAGPEKLYADVVDGKFRQVFVSPEIATSSEFQKGVLSKSIFTDHLRAVNIDEAHCINIWGGSFRPDYANLGVLRGRFPKNVPFLIASATLPEHVLDDIRRKLQLSKDTCMIRLTNARPNVALSVRVMQHSEDSKGDLRFLIPPHARQAEDIPITLVYCNHRMTTEDAADRARDWAEEQGIPRESIAFYHALIGDDKKRQLEFLLAAGIVRILFCTDAVGMGCDMRNIERVILWGLPPTFCALVQRAGRAGRDLTTQGEAILIVPQSVINEGLSTDDLDDALADAVIDSEALNREATDSEVIDGIPAALDSEGIRISGADESDAEKEKADVKGKRKKRYGKDTNIYEAKGLSQFAGTKGCRRKPWDDFFENAKKLQLDFPTNTSFRPMIGMRCCDNCEPRLFPVERIEVQKPPGLKRGKKRKFSEEDEGHIRDCLLDWRDNTLLPKVYGPLTSLAGRTLLGDDIIEKLATCGEQIESYSQLRQHVRWALGHDMATNDANENGLLLVEELKKIHAELDDEEERRESSRYTANTQQDFQMFEPGTFNQGAIEEAPPLDWEDVQLQFEVLTPEDFQ